MLEGSNAEPLRGQEAEMEKKKKRNIILCSDGTGNKGGYGADTNVFKIFNVVDIHNKDLYEFLVRNYEPGDKIFLFGFSRGAATVRAFAGMIQECGLLDRNHADCKKGGEFDEQKFEEQIGEAIKAYVMHECCPRHALEFKKKAVKEPLMIKMIGVWDTVDAVGLPFDELADFINYFIYPFKFSDLMLSPKVSQGRHAISIDDDPL
ncbi:MAG: DUF2235 domain-containing protein, partial [Rhodospirillales bacterium]|nr:DUF2235 domain-containing protein [Rhodospirillales bacterium]